MAADANVCCSHGVSGCNLATSLMQHSGLVYIWEISRENLSVMSDGGDLRGDTFLSVLILSQCPSMMLKKIMFLEVLCFEGDVKW